MTEWTKQQYEVAMQQRDELFPGYADESDPETEEVAENMLEILCQRNLLLERFKELHKAGGQVWIESLIHRIEPEWKSYWTLLAEEEARECALANEDGCPTGEHTRTEGK